VQVDTYVHHLADLRDRFEWADLDEQTYEALRTTSQATADISETRAGADA
jgi:hypothetical protein